MLHTLCRCSVWSIHLLQHQQWLRLRPGNNKRRMFNIPKDIITNCIWPMLRLHGATSFSAISRANVRLRANPTKNMKLEQVRRKQVLAMFPIDIYTLFNRDHLSRLHVLEVGTVRGCELEGDYIRMGVDVYGRPFLTMLTNDTKPTGRAFTLFQRFYNSSLYWNTGGFLPDSVHSNGHSQLDSRIDLIAIVAQRLYKQCP
jgi:hypothetical protein